MESLLHLVLKKHQHRLIRSLQIKSIIDWIYSYPSKKTDYMIDRMTFYRSFCEKVKEGFVFTRIGKEKECWFLVIHHGGFTLQCGLIHHDGLNLCASASLRAITLKMIWFSKSAASGFFCFHAEFKSPSPPCQGGITSLVPQNYSYEFRFLWRQLI